MKVFVPYAAGHLHPRVVPSIERQGYTAQLWECANVVGDPRSYPAFLREQLLGADDFAVIEHDVESRPGFLDELRDCPEPWCFYAYDLRVSWEEAVAQPNAYSAPLGVDFAPLGHTRFRAGIGEFLHEVLESRVFGSTWVARDVWIAEGLRTAGFTAHRHAGKAIHHHDYTFPHHQDDSVPMSQ